MRVMGAKDELIATVAGSFHVSLSLFHSSLISLD